MTAIAPARDIHAEYAALQDAYDAEEAALRAKGFTVAPKCTSDWLAFMRLYGANTNPSFEPSQAVTAENSLSLICRDPDGQAVGAIALRAYDMADIREHLVTGRLWWPAHEAIQHRVEYVLPGDFPPISGRVVQIGGLKVVRNGHRIGSHLDAMARLAAASLFHADHIVAIRMSDKVAEMPGDYYGARRTALAVRALSIGCPAAEFHLTHISREELLGGLMDGGDDDVLDAAHIVGYAGY
jgi:hypothetical protein